MKLQEEELIVLESVYSEAFHKVEDHQFQIHLTFANDFEATISCTYTNFYPSKEPPHLEVKCPLVQDLSYFNDLIQILKKQFLETRKESNNVVLFDWIKR